MKLSTKGRYAVTAMLDLALRDSNELVTLADISECHGISLSYLEQIFARLRQNNLVKGIRGPGGGYRLGGNAKEISIASIIVAVDETMDITRCAGEANCNKGHRCLTHELWIDLSDQLFDFLDGISLNDLVMKNKNAVEILQAS